MNIRDDMWKDAFDEISRKEYEELPIVVQKHRFSLKFRYKISKLLKQAGRTEHKRENPIFGDGLFTPVRSEKRAVYLAVLMAFMAGGTVFATEPLVNWLYGQYIESHSDHVEVQSSEETAPVDIGEFRKYELSYVPEGFELMSVKYDEIFYDYNLKYKNQEGKFIFVKQGYLDLNGIGLTSTENEMLEIGSGKFNGYYVPDQKLPSLILSDGTYNITISGLLSQEELLNVAEGLILK